MVLEIVVGCRTVLLSWHGCWWQNFLRVETRWFCMLEGYWESAINGWGVVVWYSLPLYFPQLNNLIRENLSTGAKHVIVERD